MSLERIGVCIVGAGDMGGRHLRAWRKVAGAEVVAICDPDPERARALAHEAACDYYADHGTAVARGDVDAVSVCTPTFLHPLAAIDACAAGKHVFCEKPIALTLADADRMAAAASSAGVILGVDFMRRCSAQDSAIAGVLREGRLGWPVLARSTITAGVRAKRAMHFATANGGPIVDMCCHVFDQWSRFLGSEPVRVSAWGRVNAARQVEYAGSEDLAVDTAAILVEYASGSAGVITVSWGLPAGTPAEEEAELIGPDGLLRTVQGGLEVVQGTVRTVLPVSEHDPWDAAIARFAGELRGASEVVTARAAEGRAALAVSLAALESIRTGRPVTL